MQIYNLHYLDNCLSSSLSAFSICRMRSLIIFSWFGFRFLILLKILSYFSSPSLFFSKVWGWTGMPEFSPRISQFPDHPSFISFPITSVGTGSLLFSYLDKAACLIPRNSANSCWLNPATFRQTLRRSPYFEVQVDSPWFPPFISFCRKYSC